MNEVKSFVEDEEIPFLLGFPNERSFSPLVQFGQWQPILKTNFLEWSDYPGGVASSDEIKTDVVRCEFTTPSNIWTVPYKNDEYIEWKKMRYSYKSAIINKKTYIVYKHYDRRTLDIVDVHVSDMSSTSAEAGLKNLVSMEGASKAIITNYHAKKIGLKNKNLESWDNKSLRMCSLEGCIAVPNIDVSLLMSDIF
jgi:hypothetical protein